MTQIGILKSIDYMNVFSRPCRYFISIILSVLFVA